MDVAVLLVALVSGLATTVFILLGLRLAFVRRKRIGVWALVATTLLSVATGAFTIWQLVLVAQQLHLAL